MLSKTRAVVVGIFLILSVATPSVFFGQNAVLTWKDHVRLAEKAISDGLQADAAAHFEAAFFQKPKNLTLAARAAQAFAAVRDYRKAAEFLQKLLTDPRQFPTARRDYAIVLQQNGQFDDAIPEFLLYLNNYEGKDRPQVSEQIEERVNGCTLGIRQAADSTILSNINVEHLPFNTPDNDIAPVPFGDDILYFTTLSRADSARIFRSQQSENNDWSAAQALRSLPISPKTPYGNGTFSPDGGRFYCTICQNTETRREKRLSCGIFFLKRTADGWSSPARLSASVNAAEGGMTTHPFVFHKGNKEFLFFASDRNGGHGGMDIWLTSRFRNDENSEFEPPLNLGSVINTEGDEVTPFYDADDKTLYFASNGRPTVGGLDIFKSEGWQQRWTSPANLGAPFNSGADDWYFVKNPSRTGGFFVSNRPFGMEKISSRDDDIFQFTLNDRREQTVSGRVFEKNTNNLLENPRVSLYEKRGSGEESLRLLSSVMSSDGAYNFSLLPQKTFQLEVEKDGFRVATAAFSTKDSAKNLVRDVYLERYATFVSIKNVYPKNTDSLNLSKQEKALTEHGSYLVKQEKNTANDSLSFSKNKKQETKNNNSSLTKHENSKNTEGSNSIKNEKLKIKTAAESTQSVVFKVQVLAYETDLDNVNISKLKRVEDLGDFETETAEVNGKRFTRVLFNFDNYAAAAIALRTIKDRSLADAFIIRYENGKRTNRSK